MWCDIIVQAKFWHIWFVDWLFGRPNANALAHNGTILKILKRAKFTANDGAHTTQTTPDINWKKKSRRRQGSRDECMSVCERERMCRVHNIQALAIYALYTTILNFISIFFLLPSSFPFSIFCRPTTSDFAIGINVKSRWNQGGRRCLLRMSY